MGGGQRQSGAKGNGRAVSGRAELAPVLRALTSAIERAAANTSELLTIVDVSRLLHCSEDTVRRIDNGDLPVHRVGKVNLYIRADVIAYVRSRRVRPVGRAAHPGNNSRAIGAIVDDLLSSEPANVRELSERKAK